METIDIVYDVQADLSQGSDRSMFAKASVSADALRDNVHRFTAVVGSVIDGAANSLRSYELEEVSLNVEIGAEGKLSLLGCGVDASGKAGMILTFKRKTV